MHKRILAGLFALAVGTPLAAAAAPPAPVAPAAPPVQSPAPAAAPAAPLFPGGLPTPAPGPLGGPCGPAPDVCSPCPPTDPPCGPPGRFWVRAEYLLWWMKDTRVPALVTAGPANVTALPGALGQPGTQVLLGGSDLDPDPFHGARFTVGMWLNDARTFGVEGSYFFLARETGGFTLASPGTPGTAVIARPFFDVLAGVPNAQIVAFPGVAAGRVAADSSTRLQGAEVNALCNACCGCGYRVDWLAGFRYLRLDDELTVTETTTVNPALPPVPPFFGGHTITATDRFATRNEFYGGQVGVRGEWWRDRVFVNGVAKFALGNTRQELDVAGTTTITPPGGVPVVTPAGMLATRGNVGHFSRDRFTFVPEFGVNAGVQVTDGLRAFAGYSILYWSSVLRPGEQIDPGLSGTGIPTDLRFNPGIGPARPAPLLNSTDFWVHGLNLGLEFRY